MAHASLGVLAVLVSLVDDDVFYLFLQKQNLGPEPSSIYTFRKVRTLRGCLEGLALMI